MCKKLELHPIRKPGSYNNGVIHGQVCTVCNEKANGIYFGAIVCLPCKSFFIRCTKEGKPKFSCTSHGFCDITHTNRLRCQYCRFKKCLEVGMFRKEKPENVQPAEGQELCRICSDIANGIHFGIVTCEGCKKFFRRALQESLVYSCKANSNCVLTPRNRNSCRYCRFQKCLQEGMSRKAIRMGRPRKSSDRESVRLKTNLDTEPESWITSNPCSPSQPLPVSPFSWLPQEHQTHRQHNSSFIDQLTEEDLFIDSNSMLSPTSSYSVSEPMSPFLDSISCHSESNLSVDDMDSLSDPMSPPVNSHTHFNRVPSPCPSLEDFHPLTSSSDFVSHPIIDIEGNLTDMLASLEPYQEAQETELMKQEVVSTLSPCGQYANENSGIIHPETKMKPPLNLPKLQELGSFPHTIHGTQGWDCQVTEVTEDLIPVGFGVRYEARITAMFPYSTCRAAIESTLENL